LRNEFGSKGIKIEVLGEKLDGFPRGNPKSGFPCSGELSEGASTCHGEFPRTEPMILGFPGSWGRSGHP